MTTWLYSSGTTLATLRREIAAWALKRQLTDSDDLTLVVNELVTNAVLHAHAVTVVISLEQHGAGALVSVEDPSPAPPIAADAGSPAESGRGLLLVAALSEKWGSTALPTGKRVWCEVSGGQPVVSLRNARE